MGAIGACEKAAKTDIIGVMFYHMRHGPKIHSQGLIGVVEDTVGMCEGGNGKLDVICANSVGVGDSV